MLAPLSLLWLIARAHFFQRPVRTMLTITGVALGVSASVAVRTANLEVLKGFEDSVMAVAGPASLEVSGGELGLDETIITTLRNIPGVAAAKPVIEQGVRVAAGARESDVLVVMGLDLLDEAEQQEWRLSNDSGADSPLDRFLSPDAVLLGQRVANELDVARGSPLTLQVGARLVQVRVAGIIEGKPGLASVWDRLAVMDIAAAQTMLGMAGRLDRIAIVTERGRSIEEVRQSLAAVVPASVVVRRPSQRTEQVEQMIRSFQMNIAMLSAVGLLVGMFLIYNTVSFAVAQRRREIGIFRALGMSEGAVCGVFLCEAAVMGAVGGLCGSLLGASVARGLVTLLSRTISDLYVSLAADQRGWMSGASWLDMCAGGILLGTLVSMVGALGPSLDASRTVTVRALAPGDYESSRRLRVKSLAWAGSLLLVAAGALASVRPVGTLPLFGYLSMLALLAGLSCLAPLLIHSLRWWRGRNSAGGPPRLEGVMRHMALEHAARNPGRNAVTVSALMVGLAIMVGVVVMIRSFRHTVEIWVNETVMADLVVAPSTWLRGQQSGSLGRTLPAEWEEVMASLEGVAAVDTYRDLRVEIGGQSVSLVSRNLALHAERSRYLFLTGDSSAILRRTVESGGVVVSEVLASRLGVHEGETLTMMTPSGERQLTILGVFYDYATDGGKVVMDRALYRRLWGDAGVTVFPVYVQPGVDLHTLRQTLARSLPRGNLAEVPPAVISNGELRQEILEIFDRTFALTYALEIIAVVIAILGIVNTLVTSVLERRREFATLRAIGASEGQVKQLVMWEAVYLGALGALLGVVGGVMLAVLLITVINKQSFGWTIQPTFPVSVLGEAVVLALLAALCAAYWPARRASRQSLVEGLRYE